MGNGVNCKVARIVPGSGATAARAGAGAVPQFTPGSDSAAS